ncbi:uncharacterized protein B0H64DRAFT_409148 [Chaetomium fimeti]|uniref:F-box domain-containing protein n=1 Tax=Chaetomium fimeti TaxID=1854472 RepID=A0AAE0LN30_9PEZI|nr:hypothetical protein B0H64DRAFT_409148 [Chaetomium fimeti]
MPNRFSKLNPFTRLQKRAAASLTLETQTVPQMPASRPRERGSGRGDDPKPGLETTYLDRQQQQLDSGAGKTVFETAVLPAGAFESLPAELRCQILSYLDDLEDLRALAMASPVFYQQYLLDRRALLERILTATLGNSLADAYAVHTSDALYEDSSDHHHPPAPEVIGLFIDDYVALRTATPELILEGCTEETLIDIASFYHSLARPLVLQSAALFCHALDPYFEVGDLSQAEQKRLLRALYRFQLHCNLFGEGRWGRRGEGEIGWEEQLSLFFSIYQSWEAEELYCIYTLIENKYEEVFAAVQWDANLGSSKSKGRGRPDTPSKVLNLREELTRESSRDGTLSRPGGLRLFYEILKTQNHDSLIQRVQEHAVLNPRHNSGRCRFPEDGDRAPREWPLFSGDTTDGPPLAWVTGPSGRYPQTRDYPIPDSLKWGYVFWDRRRFMRQGGVDHVLREREYSLGSGRRRTLSFYGACL